MDSRERVTAAAERRPTDRPPTGLRCTPEAWGALRKHLGVGTNGEVLDELDIDLRWIALPFAGPKERSTIPLDGEGTDFWGCRFRKAENDFNTYYEFDHHPLRDMRTLQEIDSYEWPELDWWDYGAVRDQIEAAWSKAPRAVLFFAGGAFETPWYLRGFERFMLDLYDDPAIAAGICGHVQEYYLQRALRVLDAGGGRIDVIGSGGDIGGERSMLLDPEVWRTRIRPYTGKLISTFRDMGLKTFYHSCGSLVPVIDDLIDLGLDFLEPIQVTAAGMDPASLSSRFGARLSFHGAIDEVNLLPRATPAQVYEETTRTIDVLGRHHGLIVAPSHAVQGDTPPENIVAIYEAARDYPRRGR